MAHVALCLWIDSEVVSLRRWAKEVDFSQVFSVVVSKEIIWSS